jgi:hypothetical protein
MRIFQIFVLSLLFISGKSQVSQNTEFERSKGKWPPPISNFSKYINFKERISVSYIEIPDQGLSIVPGQNDSVKSVFKGKVISVFRFSNVFAVMTNYGDYFITYAYLDSPVVKKGDQVTEGEFLGMLSIPYRQLELMLTDSRDKEFDPYEWFKWPDAKNGKN